MNNRLLTILRELMAEENAVTSSVLAGVLDVTTRTVRGDIKALDAELSGHGAAIESLKGKGYRLRIEDDQKFRKYLTGVLQEDLLDGGAVPNLPEERVSYLIKRLLLAEGYVKQDALAEEIHISKSTVQSDLKTVKNILASYGIHLEKRPNYGLKATGSEVKKRFCMSEYLFDRTDKLGRHMLEANLTSLAEKDLSRIWKIILNQVNEHGLRLSDIAINNLFIHIAIAYQRIKSGHYVEIYKQELNEILDQREYQVAVNMVGQIEKRLDVTFPQTEIAYIAIHLLGTKMLNQVSEEEKAAEQVMEKEVYELVTTALEAIETKMNLGIAGDQELIVGLGLHLRPAINRYRFGMNIRNPMLTDIKTNYPVAFEAGIIAGMKLEEVAGVKIDENEIGYLALHLGAAIERRKLKSGPKRCLIVCASGLGSAQLLYYKLKSRFSSKLEIVGTTEYYKLADRSFDDIDLVISSIPIEEELPVPIIEVNTILGKTDLNKIERYVLDDNPGMYGFFKEELFFPNQSLASREEVIDFLSGELNSRGLVEESFREAVIEREQVAPTAFGNLVAVPHPITPQSEETFLAVCTLDKPIMWAESRVQFICLLCVKKDSTEDLQSMYELLGKIIDDASMVQRLIKASSYQAFLEEVLKQS